MSRRSSVIRRESVEIKSVQADTPAVERSYRSLVPWLLLFAGSGCAALIYEIVWFQLLQLVIGSSAVSLGLLLAAYMGGLCLGSAALPRLVSTRHHPMRVYALLELGIAAFGILALFGVPLVARLYVAGAGQTGLVGLILRGAVAAGCLLPPTFLMGASLPAIARWVETTPRGVSWLGLLYSANVAGAVTGCVLAGFYLLRVHDMAYATYIAAAINIAVALLALAVARSAGRWTSQDSEERPEDRGAPIKRAPAVMFVYAAIAFSGLTALGAEVVWTRLLSLLLGATVYTFSIILAVFLTGLWMGSGAGSFLARRVRDPRLALAGCQILLAVAIAWTAFTLAYMLPWWPVDPWLAINPWVNFDLDLTRCIRAIFPATLLWGASFPLALAAAAAKREDPARLTGEVYAANTAGSIVGALAFSLLLIPAIGTRGSEQVLIWLAAAAAVIALAPFASTSARLAPGKTLAFAAASGCAAVLAWGLAATVGAVPWQAIAYGRRVAPILRGLDRANDAETTPVFVGEGINSSVVITERGDQKSFYVSGKSEASSALLDMRLQRMMGHLPALMNPAPHSVLVVGFGAGVTAGSFVPYPDVASIVICELEPMIPPASDEFFGKENYHVLRDSRTRVVYDDARHYILITPEKFDVITTDPIHPWVKGTSTLYSREYYEMVKRHLNPGGVAAQWLPIYESDEETVKTELATFFSVFPDATVWSNYLDGDGYDLVLLGRADPSPINSPQIDVDMLERRLNQSSYSAVSSSLADVRFHSAVDLLATYAGRAQDLAPLLSGAQINDDLNMRLQYLAGLGLNSVTAPQVYRELLSYRKFPADLLIGRGDGVNALHELIGRPHRTF
ncbi:MAG: fused MFS/spermidine synthase [Bryobacterales bacterium]|nr:fused MFS/spermidine synthase [Bryobacterales bacterium]